MSKSFRIILFIILTIVAAGVSFGLYLYNKPHVNVAKLEPDAKITAHHLFTEFQKDETAANEKYLGKVIEIKGIVGEVIINENGSINIILRDPDSFSGINCAFETPVDDGVKNIVQGDQIIVRGLCSGMLLDVVLNRCILVE